MSVAEFPGIMVTSLSNDNTIIHHNAICVSYLFSFIVGYGLPWGEVFPGESVALWVLVQLAVVSSQNLQRGVANAFLEPGELLLSALPLLKIS